MLGREFVPERSGRITMDEIEAARRTVAGSCSGPSELSELLELLGIGSVIDPGVFLAD